MTLPVPITPDLEARLRKRAASVGKDPATYAADVIARDLARASLDETLAPLRDEVEKRGLSEDQLSDLLERAKHDLRRDRRTANAS